MSDQKRKLHVCRLVAALCVGAPVACSHTGKSESGTPLKAAPSSPLGEVGATQVSPREATEQGVTPDIGWSLPSCDRAGPLPNLVGLELARAKSRFGTPMSHESFRLEERLDEFHIALRNTYPMADPKNANVRLQELTWANGECRLTVWFHLRDSSWQSFENLRWPQGAEF